MPGGVVAVVAVGRAARTPLPAGALRWADVDGGARAVAAGARGRARLSIIYTSGTTGEPKGVVREHRQRRAARGNARMLAEIFQLGEGERTVIPAPMYHTAPERLRARVRRCSAWT